MRKTILAVLAVAALATLVMLHLNVNVVDAHAAASPCVVHDTVFVPQYVDTCMHVTKTKPKRGSKPITREEIERWE